MAYVFTPVAISPARTNLKRRLGDVQEIISARDSICTPGRGRPAQRMGAAVIRGGIILLSAAFEAYTEELFCLAVDQLYATVSAADREQLKKSVTDQLQNATSFKVNRAFFSCGIAWLMHSQIICWPKMTNEKARITLDELISTRNHIAHGEDHPRHWAFMSASEWHAIPGPSRQTKIQNGELRQQNTLFMRRVNLQRSHLVSWREYIDKLSERLDKVVWQFVRAQTGQDPW